MPHRDKEENFRILKMLFKEFSDIITSGWQFAPFMAYVSPIWRPSTTGGRQIANLAIFGEKKSMAQNA